MLDINKDYATVLKVALKGSDKALAQAYRRSLWAMAKHDQEFGPESQPNDLNFRWEWINGYRVLSLISDGAGITVDFNGIEGLTEYVYAFHDDFSLLSISNDKNGILLNDRDKFGIPRTAEFELSDD